MARIIASVQRRDPTPLVVGSSALLFHGVRGWIVNPNVELYQPKRRTSQLIPPFRCAAKPVAAVRRVYRRGPPITSERTRVSGLLTEHPYDALIRCAMHDDALQAFALGCSALHKWSGFSNFSQDACRGRAEDIRKEILSRLERAKGRRGYARARRILSSIDPGCDNPAEAALTWVVRALCPYEVSTQYELSTADRRFFADIAIPHCKLIIEFDGSRNWDQHKENSTARNARGFNANRCCKIRAGISSESTGLISTIGMHCAVGLAMRSG